MSEGRDIPGGFASRASECLKQIIAATDQAVEVIPPMIDVESESDHVLYCLGLVAKVLDAYEAVKLLCKNGMGNCGLVLTRVMFEDAVQMKWVADMPSVRYLKVLDQELAEVRSLVAKMRRVEGSLPFKVDDVVSRKDQEFLANNVSGKARRDTFRQACDCKLEHFYIEAYSYACTYIHTTSHALRDYVREEQGLVTLGSFRQQTTQALAVAAASVLLAFETGLPLCGLQASAVGELRQLLMTYLPTLVGYAESTGTG